MFEHKIKIQSDVKLAMTKWLSTHQNGDRKVVKMSLSLPLAVMCVSSDNYVPQCENV